MYQPAKGPGYVRNKMSCTYCQAGSTATLNKFAVPYYWMSRWLKPGIERTAGAWAESVEPAQLQQAEYENWSIGEWVRSSVHSHFRTRVLDFDNPGVVSVYRRYLASGLTMAHGLTSLIEHERPDLQLIFNGRMAPTRIALEIAKKEGIRVLAEERGFVPGFMRLVENTHCLDPAPFYGLWEQWQSTALSPNEVEQLKQLLTDHMRGDSFEVSLFAAIPSGADAVARELGLDRSRPIITAFTSATDESACQSEAAGILSSQSEWLERTINFAGTTPGHQFVIRAHPNTSGKRALGVNETESALLADLERRAPPNVTVVAPEADISSFDLIALSQAGLIWHSTVGLEMAAQGKPVLRAGAYWFRDASFMITPRDSHDYENALQQLLKVEDPQETLDRTIQAWRFAYCWFFRQSFHFPLVKQPDWARGDFNFESAASLEPGQDESLDQICSVIMDGESVLPRPDNRSASDAQTERNALESWLDP